MITKTFYAPCLKKIGAFFFWHELADDGYGIYYPRHTDISSDDLPAMFDTKMQFENRAFQFHEEMWSSSPVIKMDDIELVPVTISL